MTDSDKIDALIAKAEDKAATVDERVEAVKKAVALIKRGVVDDHQYTKGIYDFRQFLENEKGKIEKRKDSLKNDGSIEYERIYYGCLSAWFFADAIIQRYEKTFPYVSGTSL